MVMGVVVAAVTAVEIALREGTTSLPPVGEVAVRAILAGTTPIFRSACRRSRAFRTWQIRISPTLAEASCRRGVVCAYRRDRSLQLEA